MNSFQTYLLTITFIITIIVHNAKSDSNSLERRTCNSKLIWDLLIQPRTCQKNDNVNGILPKVKIPNVTAPKVAKLTKTPKVAKNDGKLSHMQKLLKWIGRMKILWSDFPVYKSQSESAKSWFSCCKNDKVTLGKGLTSKNGTIAGYGLVTYDKLSNCYIEQGVELVNGTFVDGHLDGMATVRFANQSQLRAPFSKGVLSGLARMFTCQYGVCDFSYEPWNQPTWLSQVSFYDNGLRIGPAWEFKIGGGILVGHADHKGDLTGDDITYVYPDFTTMLVGKFSKSVMISAKQTILTDVRFNRISKIPHLLYDKQVLENSKDVYSYDESNKEVISHNPLLQDPYEKQMVYVARSSIPGAGFGIFSKRPAKKGMMVGLYSGVRMHNIEAKTAEERKSQYRIDNDWAKAHQIIDIPVQYRPVEKYNATLGHILNHNPKPNAWYGMVDHPRFGKIRSIVLYKDVPANEELFCDYGYMESYIKTEETIKTLFNIGKWITNKEGTAFAQDVKDQIKFIKSKSDELGPYLQIVKMAASFFGKST